MHNTQAIIQFHEMQMQISETYRTSNYSRHSGWGLSKHHIGY